MTHRALVGKQSLLRIFVGEFDKYHHKSLYKVILETSKERGLAGCTILRGYEGFGRGGYLHTGIDLEGAGERSLVIEIVDEPDRINTFWKEIEPMLSGALVTEEKVHVHRYQAGESGNGFFEDLKKEGNMVERELSGENSLLRIYVGESDKVGHHSLHFEILQRARKFGLAGATTIHGVAGFGANSIIHTPHLFRLASDLPVIIEIVDIKENVQKFLSEIAPVLQGALVTEEKVTVYHYSSRLREK